ncbi:DNA polymerase IV [Bifidobacterium ramosum]|uniref:DNA polymerase IV n=1 Tax=Bifidobacterium ramosum TaxID=1798158 RepID=A0A6L4WXI1_9BIFI|nr:DNA polymerase IV [Bifidobacterium ramosum]KAB8286719.1 DNA polymerase IV [Bifidobacterium ramosum]NEG71750.1 DNA polymerase IV [Bifidobacterium ramosum]
MSTAPRLAAAKRDWGHDETGCTVLHIDMDAFYASLEVARHPELKGRPVIIGTGPRSVVSAASYEARRYGINSAMPSARARQLCPNGVFLPVDMTYYRMMSRRIFTEVFSQVTDRIEQVSVDECYMDVSGALLRWERPSAIGTWLRSEVARRYHVTCSVGIAANKLVAKMASTNAKPDGMLLIPVARHAEFVQMMPLRGIPGIGPSLEKRLTAWGVRSVADLAAMSEDALTRACGSATMARGLYAAARGLDGRAVTPYTPEKSIGAERTFDEDTRDMRRVRALLRWACDDVASSLRRRGLMARTVTVKLRFADLSYMTKAHTMDRPLDAATALYPECVTLLRAMLGVPDYVGDEVPLPREIRLAGMSASGLVEAAGAVIQPTLDDVMEEAGVRVGVSGSGSGMDVGTDMRTGAGVRTGTHAVEVPATASTDHGHTATGTPRETRADRLRGAEQALDAVRRKYGTKAATLGL